MVPSRITRKDADRLAHKSRLQTDLSIENHLVGHETFTTKLGNVETHEVLLNIINPILIISSVSDVSHTAYHSATKGASKEAIATVRTVRSTARFAIAMHWPLEELR